MALPIVLIQENLQVFKGGPTEVSPGSRARFSISVEGVTEATVGPLVVEDILPAGTTWVAGGTGPWECVFDAAKGPAGTVRCTYTGQQMGDVTLDLTLEIPDDPSLIDTTMTNTATARSASPETNMADNSATAGSAGHAGPDSASHDG